LIARSMTLTPAFLHPLAPFFIDQMHVSQIFQVNNCLQGSVALQAPIEWHNDPQTNLPHETHDSGPASTRTSDMDAATAKLISFLDPEEPLVLGRLCQKRLLPRWTCSAVGGNTAPFAPPGAKTAAVI
jgi:hypothetical protein